MIPAHFLLEEEEGNLIVRMFRLPPPDPATIRWIAFLTGLFLLTLIALVLVDHLRTRWRREAGKKEELSRVLESARLQRRELDVFHRLVRASGGDDLECATRVQTFDRAVAILLGEALPRSERLELLRALRRLRHKLGLDRLRRGVPLASSRSIPHGQTVAVTPADPPREGEVHGGTFLIASEDSLTIQLDGGTSAAPALRGQRRVEVSFNIPGDSIYSFVAPVVGLRELDALFLVLEHPPVLQRVQNRSLARVEIASEVRFQHIASSRSAPAAAAAAGKGSSLAGHRGKITDLSGGGVALETREKLSAGDCLLLTLPFLPPPADRESLTAQVTSVRDTGKFGLAFHGLSPRLQAAILQFVRKREVELARETSSA